MIERSQLAALSPAKRAQVIYAQAQSELSNRLWRAALGDADRRDRDGMSSGRAGLAQDSLLQLLAGTSGTAAGGCACQRACSCHGRAASADFADDCIEDLGSALKPPALGGLGATLKPAALGAGGGAAMLGDGATVVAVKEADAAAPGLGANARYAPAFALAEARTGVPANALAAIVDAEAGKASDGSWNPHSRNPRSSAAGLGQFLSGTWQNLAETPGTWLNQLSAERGWLDARGRVQPGARANLLSLRYDPEASILGVADLARGNLDRLEASGIRVRTDAETLAKSAYLSHHLGLGDAKKFLAGGIEPGRARMLLSAQIGSAAAEQRIAGTGDATRAHRQWLLGFIERRIRPDRFGG